MFLNVLYGKHADGALAYEYKKGGIFCIAKYAVDKFKSKVSEAFNSFHKGMKEKTRCKNFFTNLSKNTKRIIQKH